jgi:valyl-tRNA synthetase
MSKTQGNVLDPIELLDEYGADAVRFTLSSMAVPGTDIPFSSDRMKGYAAFANKVWNAARFVLMNLDEGQTVVTDRTIDGLLRDPESGLEVEDRWILHRLNGTAGEISQALEKFRFHDASSLIYQFLWHELCDWYIELVKPVLLSGSGAVRDGRVAVLVYVLERSLRLLHPFMPFITEEIWQKVPHEGESIMVQPFPCHAQERDDPGSAEEMEDLMDLVVAFRSARAEMNIEPKKSLAAAIAVPDPRTAEFVARNLDKVTYLARLERLDVADSVPDSGFLRGVWKRGEFGLNLEGAIDLTIERDRLSKEIERTRGEIEKLVKKLGSSDFVARAPEAVVGDVRDRHADLVARREKLESNLRRLPTA